MTESSDLTPQQDAVRRLLAEARHDGPTPPEVVARLDATLSSLQAERAAEGDTREVRAPVIDLGARRRRLASMGVLAAAAVVVAGVALGQLLPQGSDDMGADSATSAETSTEFGGQESPGAEDNADGGLSGESSEPSSKYAAPQAALPEVDLDADLDSTLTDLRSTARSTASDDAATMAVACEVGGVGKAQQVYVEIDGQRGVVVYRKPRDARQEAEVYVCGDAEPLRTVSLPAP